MLSGAKHLSTYFARLFASLRVTTARHSFIRFYSLTPNRRAQEDYNRQVRKKRTVAQRFVRLFRCCPL